MALARDVILFLVFCATLLVLWAAFNHAAYSYDGLVGTLERHFQVVPGATRVLPECNCTVRYLGTSVHGRRYTVIIERLD